MGASTGLKAARPAQGVLQFHTRCQNRRICPSSFQFRHDQKRFFTDALNPLQTLSASRILPYHARDIFKIIADIDAYSTFLPYCTSSKIRATSLPDPVHKIEWPHVADLKVGYGPYEETFSSTVYCVPYTTLEAVSGDAQPTISAKDLPHYDTHGKEGDRAPGEQHLFSSLLTQWSFHEYPFKPMPPQGQTPEEGNAEAHSARPRTQVSLNIKVKFASPVYSALSQAAAPKVAGFMIEAFEKRAIALLGTGHGPISEAERSGGTGTLQRDAEGQR